MQDPYPVSWSAPTLTLPDVKLDGVTLTSKWFDLPRLRRFFVLVWKDRAGLHTAFDHPGNLDDHNKLSSA